jgi:hypothetical protein
MEKAEQTTLMDCLRAQNSFSANAFGNSRVIYNSSKLPNQLEGFAN